MGKICIIGVDRNKVLKDFVKAHIDYLKGDKVCLEHWYPDLVHDGWTIRKFYTTTPFIRALSRLLPQALYDRAVTRDELSWRRVHDAFAGFFREHDVDVILAEFGPTGADITPHARALGIPLVVHFHGHDAHRASVVNEYRERYREMFSYAYRIMSVSRFMTDTLVELGAPREKIVYNPYGPRDRFFDLKPKFTQTVLSLGRFTDIKANYLTLAAFERAVRAVPGARLVMAGDGELLETCRTLARTWDLEDKVTFTGAVRHRDTGDLFENACCFAQHSTTPSYGDAEGTPVTVLEAGAAGLPVVATRHAGIPDVVVDGQTGFLVDELDVEGMAHKMIALLSDPELARSMGDKARTRVLSSFSMAQHIALLQQSIDDARSHG